MNFGFQIVDRIVLALMTILPLFVAVCDMFALIGLHHIMLTCSGNVIVRLSVLKKYIFNSEYKVSMCVCVFVCEFKSHFLL